MGAMDIPAWTITYGGTNITGNLMPHATHIFFNEHIGGKASTLEIKLEDVNHNFQDHPPAPGIAVSLSIGWQAAPQVSCGLFEVDEWESDGPPDTFTLRAIQAGISHAIRTRKSFAYENQTLTEVANSVAARYGMTVSMDAVDPDVPFERITQRTESDLAFLHRLANAHNYEFNVRGNQLVFYSRVQLDAATPQNPTIYKTDCVRYRFHKQHVGERSYLKSVITHFDPLLKKLLTAFATDPNATSQDTLRLIARMENQQQGSLKAQAGLHAANMAQIKGQIIISGTMAYRAGNTVNVAGFGKGKNGFDAVKFIVKEAKHRIDHAGYNTTLELRTTITGAAAQIISHEYGG